MGSVDEANRFVNCVMNRTRNDTVMRGGLVILLVAIPLVALIYGALVTTSKNVDGDLFVFVTAVCLTFMFYTQILVIFFLYRRIIDHSTRDKEWRSSLIGYARECGCDVSKLSDINDKAIKKEKTRAEKPAILLILALFVCIMVFVGYPEVLNVNTDEAINVIYVLIISMAVAFLMFCFVLIYLIKAPFAHESMQRNFVKEFSAQMGSKGISVPVMPKAVRNLAVGLSMILVLVTFGLFIFVILYRTFVNTNFHIMNQWDYEVKLMDIIIKNEGGIGVIPNKAIEAE